MELIYCSLCSSRLERADDKKFVLICRTCSQNFYENPIPTTAAILSHESTRVLLVRRRVAPHANAWDLPGGFFQPGETAEASILRELDEELGVVPEKLSYLGSYPDRYAYQHFNYHTLNLIFFGSLPHPPRYAADDISEYRFFPIHRLPFEQIAFESMRNGLRDYRTLIAHGA